MKFILACACLSIAGVASAQLTENFNSPGWNNQNKVGDDWYVTYNTGTDTSNTDGWTILGNTDTGVDLVGSGWDTGAGTADGQWLDLAGTPGPGGIRQSFNAGAGGTFTLSFSAFTNDAIQGGGGDYGFAVYVDSTGLNPTGTPVHDYTGQLTNTWTTYDLTLDLTAGTHTLAFYTTAPNNGNVGLDSVNLAPSSTPEPITTAFAGTMLGLAVRKRFRGKRA